MPADSCVQAKQRRALPRHSHLPLCSTEASPQSAFWFSAAPCTARGPPARGSRGRCAQPSGGTRPGEQGEQLQPASTATPAWKPLGLPMGPAMGLPPRTPPTSLIMAAGPASPAWTVRWMPHRSASCKAREATLGSDPEGRSHVHSPEAGNHRLTECQW